MRRNVTHLKEFQQSSVHPDDVPYLDAAREKARQRALKALQESGGKSKGKCKAEELQRKREEAAAKAAKAAQEKQARGKVSAAKRQALQLRDDARDLDDDYRAWRKHKKGKLSDEQYKQSIGIDY